MTTPSDGTVNRCRFCGSGDTGVVPVDNCYSRCEGGFAVICLACDARGPVGDNSKDAVKLWSE